MKSWIIILIGLPSTWHYIDIASDSRIYSLLLPIIFFVFLVTAIIKIAIKLGPDGGHSSYGGEIGFGGGGDSGGGGDC